MRVWELNFQLRLMLLIWEPHVEKHFPDIISFPLGFPNVSFLLSMVIFFYTFFLRLSIFLCHWKPVVHKLLTASQSPSRFEGSYVSVSLVVSRWMIPIWAMTGAGQNILHTHYLLYKVGQVREPHNIGDDANPLVILIKETKVARVGPPTNSRL